MRAKKCLGLLVTFAVALLMSADFSAAQSDPSKATEASYDPTAITSTTIPPQYFGVSAHNEVPYGTPWPTMPVYGMRLWDTATGWGQINTAKGVYDWSTLDLWTAAAAAHGDQLIYTFGMTPTFASSGPNDDTCDYGPGFCYPPIDLNSDGSGTDQHFIDFVTAIAQHAPSITLWEMWNTPHDTFQWKGTDAQLVRMTQDAHTYVKKYIPTAQIISPANGQLNYPYPGSNCTMPDKMGGYLAAGMGKYIDIVALHTCYTTVPEDIVPVVQCYQSTMATYNLSSLPLWSTEGAWGFNTDLAGANNQAGFLARLYLLLWSNGVQRHYWYAWDDLNTGTLSSDGVPNSVGTAYTQVENWMSGRTMSTLCAHASSGIWTCGLTGSNSYAAQAVWHPGGNKSYKVPSQYINYLDLSGKQHTISSGATVTVGVEPILLQNQTVKTGGGNFIFSQTIPFPVVNAGSSGTSGTITISSQNSFSGTVTLTCPGTYGSGSCSITPPTVSSFPATATLIINGTSFTPGSYQIGVQGVSGAITNTFDVSFDVADFSLAGPASVSASQGAQATANLTLASSFSYSGQVTATCDASALSGATCTLNPASPVTVGSGATIPVTATINIPSNAAAGNYNIGISTKDASGTPSHSLTIPVTVTVVQTVQDFSIGAPTPSTQTINAGQQATYTFSVSPVGSSFPSAVTLSCSGAPALSQCAINPSPVTPGSSTASVTMTIITTRSSRATHLLGKTALLIPWLALPGLMLFTTRPRRIRRGKSALVAALFGLFMLALLLPSCGEAGPNTSTTQTGGGGQQQQGTQPGTYTIMVTGTSGSLSHQATAVTLIVN
ncbi:MAG: hypothetical protein ACRD3B_02685 [Candidatus Sulfotelmatobacter sp.]